MSFVNSTEFSEDFGSLRDQACVQQVYQDVLGRQGDSSGVDYWTEKLGNGATRSEVLTAFSDIPENKNNSAAAIGDRDRGVAYRLYQAAFNRVPDPQGLAFWTSRLGDGSTSLEVAQGMIGSAEYMQQFDGLNDRHCGGHA